jgi:hypothetical protein
MVAAGMHYVFSIQVFAGLQKASGWLKRLCLACAGRGDWSRGRFFSLGVYCRLFQTWGQFVGLIFVLIFCSIVLLMALWCMLDAPMPHC